MLGRRSGAGAKAGTLSDLVERLIGEGLCHQDGSSYPDGGSRLVADYPYWQGRIDPLPPDAYVMYFRVTIPGPGSYEAVLRLRSPEFYGKEDHWYRATITAEAA